MEGRRAPKNDAAMNLMLPRALVDAVRKRAAENFQSASSYARTALARQLASDGATIKTEADAV
jgi:hypothetical protein